MSNDKHLEALYPFLHNKKQDSASMNSALLESVKQKTEHHHRIVEAFFTQHAQTVIDAAHTIANSYLRNGRLYTMGNGGSSCDAAHIAVEFLHPVTTGRPALPAVDLSADKAMLTAVSNDVGYDHVFVRQVIAHVRAEDVLLGISTSGNSKNLIKAFAKAKEIGASTIGLSGMSGGEMVSAGLDQCLVIECDSIHRIQECHLAIYHIIWDLVHTLLADERGQLNTQTLLTKEHNNEIC